MASELQELRKIHGYKTAKDFAEAIEIPVPTYSRYEQNPEKIPLKAAWKIADFLEVSIDAVVGREGVDFSDNRGPIQRFYDDLSGETQKLFDEFIEFTAEKERKLIEKKVEAENKQYEGYVRYYEDKFIRRSEANEELEQALIFGSGDEKRARFQEFIEQQARIQRETKIDQKMEDYKFRLVSDLEPSMGEGPNGEVIVYEPTDEYTDSDVPRMVEEKRKELVMKYEFRDERIIKKIMEAYDRLHKYDDKSEFIYQLLAFDDD